MENMTLQLCFELLTCENWCLVANCCFKGFISVLTVLQIDTVEGFIGVVRIIKFQQEQQQL